MRKQNKTNENKGEQKVISHTEKVTLGKESETEQFYTYAVGVIYIYVGERKRQDEKPPKALWRFHLNTNWEMGARKCP